MCSRCGQEKAASEFTKDSRRKDGLRSYCKACERASKAKQRTERAAAVQASNRRYWKANAKRINRQRRIRYAIAIHAGSLPPWRIGEIMRVSPSAVQHYAQRFGISLATIKPGWPAEDDDRLITFKRAGMSQQDIAAQLGRTRSAVNWRLVKLRKEKRL